MGLCSPLNIPLLAPPLPPSLACLDSDALEAEACWAGHGGRKTELGPCRDEIISRDGEDTCAGPGHTHSDVTRGFSSQWKLGTHFTARAAWSLSWWSQLLPCLPCSLLLYTVPQSALFSSSHTLLLLFFCQACPSHPLLVCSLIFFTHPTGLSK